MAKVHVQGGGRPFSLAEINPLAVLSYRDVQPLVAVLGLQPSREIRLTNNIQAVMARYLAPIILADELADHAKTMRLLNEIAAGSAKLASQLSQLDNRFLVAIEQNRREKQDEQDPPPFDILSLVHKLNRLSHAARRVRAPLQPNRRGAPEQQWLDQHVTQLLDVLERLRFEVTLINSGSGHPRRRVEGRGGELLLALFRRFDPHTDQPRVWGSINRIRRNPHLPNQESEPAAEKAGPN